MKQRFTTAELAALCETTTADVLRDVRLDLLRPSGRGTRGLNYSRQTARAYCLTTHRLLEKRADRIIENLNKEKLI